MGGGEQDDVSSFMTSVRGGKLARDHADDAAPTPGPPFPSPDVRHTRLLEHHQPHEEAKREAD